MTLAPPSHFHTERKPRFLLEAHSTAGGGGAPRPAPRAVSSAAAALGLSTPRERAEGRGAEALGLVAEAPSGAPLRFGDCVRLRAAAAPVALSALPPGRCAAAEEALAAELRGSGRDPSSGDFVAVTAAPLGEAVSRRAAWEVYRVDPLDGFADDVVHYGQLLRFGQRPTGGASDEVLLSCEPPSRHGGAGSSYIVLGRPARFGHPEERVGESDGRKKAFDAAFRLMPDMAPGAADAHCVEGAPVDLRLPAMLVPVGPYSHVHGARFVRVCANDGARIAGDPRASGDRTFVVEGGREMQLEAAAMPLIGSGQLPAAWLLERLHLPKENVAACEWRRHAAHTGLPRALLGRALPDPPASVRAGVSSSASAQETPFARWEHIRSAVLRRVRARGGMGFANLRKQLTANRQVAILPVDLEKVLDDPHPGARPVTEERCLVPLDEVAATLRRDFGLHFRDDDVELVEQAFAFDASAPLTGDWEATALLNGHARKGGGRRLIDADLLVDAILGEGSPGRFRIFGRLYARLQQERDHGMHRSLPVRWVEERLTSALPPDLPGVPAPEFQPEELMKALPLLRAHCGISRLDFVRWMADLCYLLPTHGAVMAYLTARWGPMPELLDPAEARQWALRSRPASPPRPHVPPFLGDFAPAERGWPFGNGKTAPAVGRERRLGCHALQQLRAPSA